MNYAQAVQQIINTSPGVGGGGGVQNISGLTPVSDIITPYRTAFGTNGVTVGLPATVNCTFDGGGSGTVDMTWAIGSYNSGTPGSVVAYYTDAVYNIVGTPVTTGSITNTGNITDTVQITVKTPWSALQTSTVEMIFDWKQMATNTNNAYGTVDASDNITAIKSVAPGVKVGVTLASQGTAPKLTGGKGVLIGTGWWQQASPTTDFDFLSYHATATLLRHTTIFAGNVTDSGGVKGTDGNNGFNAAANNGCDFINNSTGATAAYALSTYANGVSSILWENTTFFPYGTDTVVTLALNNNNAHASGKVRGYVGTVQYDATSSGSALCDITPANPVWQIGSYGAGLGGTMSGNFQTRVYLSGTPESDAVRNKLVQDIAFYCGITVT